MQVVEFYSRNMEAWCAALPWLCLVGSRRCYKRNIEIFGNLELSLGSPCWISITKPHARSAKMAGSVSLH
jgi:hypothetical protein